MSMLKLGIGTTFERGPGRRDEREQDSHHAVATLEQATVPEWMHGNSNRRSGSRVSAGRHPAHGQRLRRARGRFGPDAFGVTRLPDKDGQTLLGRFVQGLAWVCTRAADGTPSRRPTVAAFGAAARSTRSAGSPVNHFGHSPQSDTFDVG
jgi:hypothetical protein